MLQKLTTYKAQCHGQKECARKCRATGFLSLGTGALITATALGEDNKPDAIAPERRLGSSTQQRAPRDTVVTQHRCPLAASFGYEMVCPLEDPMGWTLQVRAVGTKAICATRGWLATAGDLTQSPGVLATSGSVAAIGGLASSVPLPALWLAGVSLFSLGAVDRAIDAAVKARIRSVTSDRTRVPHAPAESDRTPAEIARRITGVAQHHQKAAPAQLAQEVEEHTVLGAHVRHLLFNRVATWADASWATGPSGMIPSASRPMRPMAL